MASIPRAEVVGSLLRPGYVKDMRAGVRSGFVSQTQRREVENRAVMEAITLQEAAGLDVITDGELRRVSWIATAPTTVEGLHRSAFSGFKILTDAGPGWIRFWWDNQGNFIERGARPRGVVVDKIAFSNEITSDYDFLRQHASVRTKFCFPSPSYHRIYWDRNYSTGAYPTSRDFLYDIADKLREYVVKPLLEMGCDYIQLDAPNYGQFYVDPKVRAAYETEDAQDMAANLIEDAEVDNYLFEGLDNVTCAMHVCRGNSPGGYWSANGGYEPLAPLFQHIPNIDTLLLEYDTPRAGDFAPLRHILPDTTVVLGLLTTKEGTLESAAEVEAGIHAAAEIIPLDRLALSPQCGFASAEGGNPLTEEQQLAKLRLVSEVARKVWG